MSTPALTPAPTPTPDKAPSVAAPPAVQLLDLVFGHWTTAALHSVARLGVADRLAAGPRDVRDLALSCDADEDSLFRVLRALAGLGVFAEVSPRCFELTPLGHCLRADHPDSVRGMILFQGAPPHWAGWGAFLGAVRTGESAFEAVHGMGFFDYCATDPDFAADFNDAMSNFSAAAAEALLAAYDFGDIRRLVDIGGGHGLLLSRILQAYPDLHGVVFDLPHVVAGAAPRFADLGLTGRTTVVAGDFFESVPSADAYIAKHIIHDWSDEHSVRILSNIARVLEPKGRVLLVEAVIEPGNERDMAKLIDLEMLNSTRGGRERTAAEFAGLFEQAGLQLTQIHLTASLFRVVEARRAP